jgi:hypothetical protein
LDRQRIRKVIRKFSYLIERNKDLRAFSDYKEGVNEGLELAKDTFEENVEKFTSLGLGEDIGANVQNLQNKYDLLIDSIDIKEKPRYSKDQLDGIREGLERSKKLFEECLVECF